MSKRRRGFPSETNVKRGTRIVHSDKLLEESTGDHFAIREGGRTVGSGVVTKVTA